MKKYQVVKSSLLAVFLAFASHAQAETAPKTIGYVFAPWWEDVSTIQYSKLDYINFAFALPGADGHLRPLNALDNSTALVSTEQKLQTIVAQAHSAGVKVLLSVGGWSDENGQVDPIFEAIGADSVRRSILANDIVAAVNHYQLDGADMDWEFPDAGVSSDNYNALMTDLHTQLHADGKLLTAAVTASSSGITSALPSVVDWVNVMSYGNAENDITELEGLKARGFTNEQLVLGVQFAGITPDYAEHAFKDLVAQGADPNGNTFGNITYNGITSMQQKADFVKSNGYGGIMIWELSEDATGANSLLTAIDNTLISPVPEPETYNLLLAGLALVGFASRKKI